jgi:hypothetical protein
MKNKPLMTCQGLAGAMLVMASATLASAADYPSTVLSQGPVGYWRLNETVQPTQPPFIAANSGTVGAGGNGEYRDVVRGALPGAIVSEPGNAAAKFLGLTDGNRVRIPYQPQWNQTGPYSIEFWAKPGQTAAIQCPAASVEFIPTPTQRNGWLFYQGDSALATGNGWVFRQYNSSSLTAQTGAAVNMTLDTNQWYHVVGVFEGNSIKVYVNGVLGGSTAFTTTARANTNPDIPLTFGARADGVSGFFTYNGMVDESAVYNVALTEAQVLAHYQAGTNAAPATPYRQVVLADNPVGYWRLDEPGDPAATNLGSLGDAGTGTYIYKVNSGVAGPTGAGFPAGNLAIGLDGTGGRVSVPGMNLNTNTVTMTAWVKASGSQNAATGLILSRAGDTVSGLTIDGTHDGLGLGYNWNNDSAAYNFAPSIDNSLPTLPDGQWAFVALVVQPTEAAIYIGPGTDASAFAAATNYISHPMQKFEGPTLIGEDVGFTPSRAFNGSIDEVAIFQRALGAGEVFSQYAAALGNIAPKLFADVTPSSPTLFAGEKLVLTVDVGGTPPLNYQWRKGGTPINGATSSALVIPSVATSDAGDYSVVVSNPQGTVTSGIGSLTVVTPTAPEITSSFASRTLYKGGILNLSVVASGGQLVYEWTKSGTAIPGATTSAYVVNSVTAADSGNYAVTVRNSAGTATAGPATITVIDPPADSYEGLILADGAQAWYRLNETAGAVMFDALGRHDGYYTNVAGTPVTLGVPGVVKDGSDKAVSFDGSQSYGVVPYSPALNNASITLECWAKTRVLNGTICPVSSRFNTRGCWFYTYPAGKWSGGVSQNNNNYYVPSDTEASTILSDQWTHLVLTYSSSTSLRVYINGQWDGQGYVDFQRNVLGPLLIGARGNSTATPADQFFQGEVDEVAVYTTALTPAQIEAHYQAALYGNNTKPVFKVQPKSQTVVVGDPAAFSPQVEGSKPLTLQWMKDGAAVPGATNAALSFASASYADAGAYKLVASNGAGTTESALVQLSVLPVPAFANATNGLVLHLRFDADYTDSSGRGNNGTAQGEPTLIAGQVGEKALHYSTDVSAGTFNYVSLGTPADLVFGTNTSFSVAFWVRQSAGSTNGDLPFLCSAINSYGNPGITFAPSYQEGGWSWNLGDEAGDFGLYGPENSINDGDWHHLAHTFDRTAGVATTYLDGIVVDETSIAGLGNFDTGNSFSIGQDPTGTYQETAEADLDDLGVWRRVLTSYEVSGIYRAGLTGTSFDTYGPVTVYLTSVSGKVVITWQAGTLMQSSSLDGPWTPVEGAAAPSYTATPGTGNVFYRVKL